MEALSFEELSSSGLLWYLNRVALHPHGLALALDYDEDEVATGWHIIQSEDGIWSYDEDADDMGRGNYSAFLEENGFT